MLKKLSVKLRAKFPATTPGCSMLKFARLDDAFLQVFFNRKQTQKVDHCSKKKRKEKRRRKKEGEKKIPKIEKSKDLGHFLVRSELKN